MKIKYIIFYLLTAFGGAINCAYPSSISTTETIDLFYQKAPYFKDQHARKDFLDDTDYQKHVKELVEAINVILAARNNDEEKEKNTSQQRKKYFKYGLIALATTGAIFLIYNIWLMKKHEQGVAEWSREQQRTNHQRIQTLRAQLPFARVTLTAGNIYSRQGILVPREERIRLPDEELARAQNILNEELIRVQNIANPELTDRDRRSHAFEAFERHFPDVTFGANMEYIDNDGTHFRGNIGMGPSLQELLANRIR